jgi:hypothetical protein
LFREIASAHPSQISGSYIYSILPVAGEGLAAITSGDELLFLHKSGLRTLSRHHDDVPKLVSCMVGCEDAENVVICGGGEGLVALFDVRTDQRVSQFKIGKSSMVSLAQQTYQISNQIDRPSCHCVGSSPPRSCHRLRNGTFTSYYQHMVSVIVLAYLSIFCPACTFKPFFLTSPSPFLMANGMRPNFSYRAIAQLVQPHFRTCIALQKVPCNGTDGLTEGSSCRRAHHFQLDDSVSSWPVC